MYFVIAHGEVTLLDVQVKLIVAGVELVPLTPLGTEGALVQVGVGFACVVTLPTELAPEVASLSVAVTVK